MSPKFIAKIQSLTVHVLQVIVTILIILGQTLSPFVATAKAATAEISIASPPASLPIARAKDPPNGWNRGLFETWESYFKRIAWQDEQRLRTAILATIQEILNGSAADYQTDEELYRRIEYYISGKFIEPVTDERGLRPESLPTGRVGWQSLNTSGQAVNSSAQTMHLRKYAASASGLTLSSGRPKVLYKLKPYMVPPETSPLTRDEQSPKDESSATPMLASQSMLTQTMAGVITVTADTITSTLGITQAYGNLVLGDYFPLSGNATWNNDILTGTGALTMSTPISQVALFSSTFTVSTTTGIIIPSESNISDFQIGQLSGFDAFSVTVSAIDLVHGTVTGTAGITLTTQGVYALGGEQPTANVSFVIQATPTGLQYTGSVDDLMLNVGGMTFQASGVSLSDEGIEAITVTLTAPAIFGSGSAVVNDLLISPSGVSLGSAGVAFDLPDLAYGDGSKLKLTGNRATLELQEEDYEFVISSTLAISLPGNIQNISTIVTLAYVDEQSQLTGTLSSLDLTVAGANLAMRNLEFSNSGVSVVSATLTLTGTLGGASATISQTQITSAGLTFAQAQLTLPDVNIASGHLTVSEITATLATSGTVGYTFSAHGVLSVTLPGTSALADLTFGIDPQGQASGTVASLDLTVAGTTLAMQDLLFSNTGVSVDVATLTLPASLGGASATISQTQITSAGLTFAQAQLTLPDVNIASGHLTVSEITATLATSGTVGYTFSAHGVLSVTLPGTSALADLTFGIDPQGQASGSVASLDLTVAGTTLAMQDLEFSNSGVSVVSATLALPASLGGASATISQTQITSAGLTFADAQISFPDIKFGDGSIVKVTGAKAKLKLKEARYGFDAQGTLVINLPGNPSQHISLAFSMQPDGNLQAVIVELNLTIAGCQLAIDNLSLSNQGLFGENVSLTLPPSLGGATGAVGGLRITQDGLSFDQVSISLPNIKFGDKVFIQNLVAKLTMAGDNYKLDVSGTLSLRLPDNNQDIQIAASLDSNGNLSASINGPITLNIATATMTLSGITLNNDGLSVASATLKLPNLLGGVEGAITDVSITGDGLSIGGGAVTVSFPDFNVGGPSTNLRVTDTELQIEFVSNGSASSYKLTLSGTVHISVGGQSASASGTVSIDNYGHLNGSVSSFNLNIAGLTLEASNIQFSGDGSLSIQSATLKLPEAFGGGGASLQNVTISKTGDLSIGGGSFTLPTIRVGGFQLQLSGQLTKVDNDYRISANGTIAIPGFGAAMGCSGIQVEVVLYAIETGQVVLQILPTEAVFDAHQVPAPYGPDATTGYSLKLQEATLGMTNCKIPVASTGMYITALSGRVTLDENSTQVNVKLSLTAGPTLFGVSAISGDLDTTLRTDPFSLAMLGTIQLLSIQVGGANASLTSNSFSADLWIDMKYLRGNLAVNAWSDYRGFHLTGSAQMTLSIDQGSIASYCIPVPRCSTRWVTGQSCTGSGWWRVCVPWAYPSTTCWWEDSCVTIPPGNIRYSVGIEVGEFSNGAWGFKGYVNILGTNYGFYIDSRKQITFGNVDSYRQVTPATVLKAQQAAELRAAGIDLPDDLEALDYIHFNALGETVIDVEVTGTPSETLFAMTHIGDAFTMRLIAPDGTNISPDNLPAGVEYREFVTYTLHSTSSAYSLLEGSAAQSFDGSGFRLSLCAPQTPSSSQLVEAGSMPVPERIARHMGDDWSGVAVLLPAQTAAVSESVASLRFLHAWPDEGALDVWVDGDPYASGLNQYSMSSYAALGVGQHTIQVRSAGITDTALLSTTVNLAEYTDYTLALVGQGAERSHWLAVDENRPLPQGHALLRFVNLASGTPAVDLTDPYGGYYAGNIPFNAASQYAELNGGQHVLQVRLADQAIVLTNTSTLTLTVIQGNIYSVFLVGTESITPGLHLISSLDAAQPARVRFLNAVAGGPNLDVLHAWPGVTPQSSLVWSDIPYSLTTSYIADPGESAHFLVTPAGISTTHLLSLTLDLESGQDYTLVAAGQPGNMISLWLEDNNHLPALGQVRLRLVALSPDAPAVDLAVHNGPVLIGNIAYGVASSYVSLAGGNYDLEIRQAGSPTVLASLPATVLKEGQVYSLFLVGLAGGQPGLNAVLNTDLATEKSTQIVYQVQQAQPGTWQAILGDGTASSPGDGQAVSGNALQSGSGYVFAAFGTVPAPKLSDASVTLRDAITAEVAWRLSSPQANTKISIYANPGPITTTSIITGSDGLTHTVEIPYFVGQRLAHGLSGSDANWVNGSLQTYTVSLLSSLPSGTYHVWIEALDERNPPTRVYIPDPIHVVLPWADTWQAGLAAAPSYGTLEVTWRDNDSADVDQYILYAQGQSTQTIKYKLGDANHFTLTGLDPTQEYTLCVYAVDTRTGRESRSEQITANPRSAPFSLSIDPPGLTLSNGQSRTITVTIRTPLANYPGVVHLYSVDEEESRLDAVDMYITFAQDSVKPTQAGVVVTGTVFTPKMVAGGSRSEVILATGGGDRRYVYLPVTVTNPYFELVVTPDHIVLGEGESISVSVDIHHFQNHTDPVELSVYGSENLSYALIPNRVLPGQSASLLITDTRRTPSTDGDQVIELWAVSPVAFSSSAIHYNIVKPDFRIGRPQTRPVERVNILAGESITLPFEAVPLNNWTRPLSMTYLQHSVLPSTMVRLYADDGKLLDAHVPITLPLSMYLQVDSTPDTPLSTRGYELELCGVNARSSCAHYDVGVYAPGAIYTDLYAYLHQRAQSGNLITYTWHVGNEGPLTATNVVVAVTLPPSTTLSSVQQGECTLNGEQVVCNLGDVPRQSQSVIELTLEVAPDMYVNLVSLDGPCSITADQQDLDRGDTDLCIDPLPQQEFDLEVSMSAGPDPVWAGQNLVYTITVSNAGPGPATNVEVHQTLPWNMTVVSLDSRCLTNLTDMDCTLGWLDPGETVTLQLTAQVPLNAGGVLVSTAEVSWVIYEFDRVWGLDTNLLNNDVVLYTPIQEGEPPQLPAPPIYLPLVLRGF